MLWPVGQSHVAITTVCGSIVNPVELAGELNICSCGRSVDFTV